VYYLLATIPCEWLIYRFLVSKAGDSRADNNRAGAQPGSRKQSVDQEFR
jgi:hypothetical protein